MSARAERFLNAEADLTKMDPGETDMRIERGIAAGGHPSVGWQLLGHAVLTAGEVLAYGTCLEFSYRQAPPALKSLVMSMMLASIGLGNAITAWVNHYIQKPDREFRLDGADYYLTFALFMLVAAILYVPYAMFYKERSYLATGEANASAGG